jgi:hypothetical protein
LRNDGRGSPNTEAGYVEAVERHFTKLRGRPLILSPNDTKQALRWFADSIPLEVVLGVLDSLFARGGGERGRIPRSLAYCDEAVRDEDRRRKQLLRGGRRGHGAEKRGDAKQLYLDAARAVETSAAPAPARDSAAAELRELARVGRDRASRTDSALQIETELVDACMNSLEKGEREEIERALQQESRSWSASIGAEVRGRALGRARARLIRERFALPDLSRLPLPPRSIPDSGVD